jgi:hypothetical protein
VNSLAKKQFLQSKRGDAVAFWKASGASPSMGLGAMPPCAHYSPGRLTHREGETAYLIGRPASPTVS